jgi:hypothetical protein
LEPGLSCFDCGFAIVWMRRIETCESSSSSLRLRGAPRQWAAHRGQPERFGPSAKSRVRERESCDRPDLHHRAATTSLISIPLPPPFPLLASLAHPRARPTRITSAPSSSHRKSTCSPGSLLPEATFPTKMRDHVGVLSYLVWWPRARRQALRPVSSLCRVLQATTGGRHASWFRGSSFTLTRSARRGDGG